MRSWEEGKNFFSREKRFFPSPQTPLPFSRKADFFVELQPHFFVQKNAMMR